jgi:[protein-PII] uridylyltransferase
VGNNIYNSFSAKLIKTLYKQSKEVLGKTIMLDEASKRVKKEQALKRMDTFLSLNKTQQKKILAIPSNLLFLRYSPKRILAITDKAFNTSQYEYFIDNTEYLSIEIIRKDSFNLSLLLSKLSNLDVVNMDICKLFDTLKYFKIDFAQKVDEEEVGFIEQIIHDAFNPILTKVVPKATIKESEITIDTEHSNNYAIMHIYSKDQKGLLAYIIEMFDQMGIDIVTAKVHTLKKHVRDMFLIEKNGNFCHNVALIIEKLTRDN